MTTAVNLALDFTSEGPNNFPLSLRSFLFHRNHYHQHLIRMKKNKE